MNGESGAGNLRDQDGQAMTSEQYCFGIFKPDAIEAGIEPDIRLAIGLSGLRMVHDQPSVQLSTEDVLTIWPSITTPHVSRTVPYMTSAPVGLFVVEGVDASERMLTIKRTFRAWYPNENPVISIMHSTDHDAELVRCVEHFFGNLGVVALNSAGVEYDA